MERIIKRIGAHRVDRNAKFMNDEDELDRYSDGYEDIRRRVVRQLSSSPYQEYFFHHHQDHASGHDHDSQHSNR